MKKIFLIAGTALILAACCNSGSHLPKAAGYRQTDSSVTALLQDIRRLNGTGELNSVMVLKDGKKVIEYYDACYGPDFMNICWSVSKTFTATAVGFAVQDGLMKVNDRIIDHLRKDQLPEVISDTLARLTIYDLLRMSSGLRLDPIGPTGSGEVKTPTRTVLEGGFLFEPGSRFKYNSHNTYLLSVAVTNETGKTVARYLEEKLFKPLGIRKYHWDLSEEGCSMGGWGLYLPTESMAKMGQFFLQKGMWKGKQLLDSAWFDQATAKQILQYENQGYDEEKLAQCATDESMQGYGYQMWVNSNGSVRLDGAHGQWVIIDYKQNAVIVVTGNCTRPKDEIKSVFKHIYPVIS